jgi:hypothetical protein
MQKGERVVRLVPILSDGWVFLTEFLWRLWAPQLIDLGLIEVSNETASA